MATMEQELEMLRAENARLKAKAFRKLGLKVSETTGCVCVYGLQKFPVSLQAEQWERLNEAMPQVMAFCAENADLIAVIHASIQDK